MGKSIQFREESVGLLGSLTAFALGWSDSSTGGIAAILAEKWGRRATAGLEVLLDMSGLGLESMAAMLVAILGIAKL